MLTNRRKGPVNTYWGDKVGICKLRPGWASKYKFGVNTNWGSEPVNTNWGPGPVNTNWGLGLINTNLVPGPVNTNRGPGPVNTNWGPGPGPGAEKYKYPDKNFLKKYLIFSLVDLFSKIHSIRKSQWITRLLINQTPKTLWLGTFAFYQYFYYLTKHINEIQQR